MNRADGWDGRKMSFHTGSRRSQPPLALSVPLSRFTSRVGGGSAFYVRHRLTVMDILSREQNFDMLARVLASYAAWLTMIFADIPFLVTFFICITVPMFVGSVIWHLWKTHPRSVVNQIAF